MDQKKEQPANVQLDAGRFALAEQQRNVYQIIVEPDVTRAQMLRPEFLAHVAAKVRPYDKLEIIKDDGTLYAEAVVLQCDRTWARIHITAWTDLGVKDVALTQADQQAIEAAVAKSSETYRVEFKGPKKLWCVIRTADSAYVREGEANKSDAHAWLAQYVAVTA